MTQVAAIAGFALRESLRRRVFVVVAVLTAAVPRALRPRHLAGLQGGARGVLRARPRRGRPRNRGGRDAARPARCSRRCSWARSSPCSSRSASCRATRSAACSSRSLVRPVRRRTLLLARFAAAAAVSAAYVIAVFLAAAVITWAIGGWWPDRVAGPAAQLALRGRDPDRAVAGGLGGPGQHRQRDRDLHGLRRRAWWRACSGQIGEALRSDTLGDVARRDELGAAVRGALPERARRDHRGHHRVHAARARARPVRRRAVRRPALWAWAVVYLAGVGAAATAGFARRDL